MRGPSENFSQGRKSRNNSRGGGCGCIGNGDQVLKMVRFRNLILTLSRSSLLFLLLCSQLFFLRVNIFGASRGMFNKKTPNHHLFDSFESFLPANPGQGQKCIDLEFNWQFGSYFSGYFLSFEHRSLL